MAMYSDDERRGIISDEVYTKFRREKAYWYEEEMEKLTDSDPVSRYVSLRKVASLDIN